MYINGRRNRRRKNEKRGERVKREMWRCGDEEKEKE
jgi:hypothetical protein